MSQYYFDHAASAPRRDEVTEAMARWQHGVVGNPSGSHRAAREARRAVEDAREEIAGLVGRQAGRRHLYRRAAPSPVSWRSSAPHIATDVRTSAARSSFQRSSTTRCSTRPR